ncbi:MAG: cytochrome c oxidase subunit II [Gammaproteobacteria bacterium]
MNQHRMYRMPVYGHPADDGFLRHNDLPLGLRSESFTVVRSLTFPAVFITLCFLSGCSEIQSTLNPAGPSALAVTRLWWWMFGFSAAMVLIVTGLWLYAMRRNPVSLTDAQIRRINQRWIIIGGLALPVIGILALLGFGIPIGYRMLPLPVAGPAPLRIDVTGHRWWWEVRYPDAGVQLKNELHLPAGEPVDVHVTSADVIHSFWVPRLAGKLDMIPGRVNVLRLEADAPGHFRGQCSEFCGLGHAHMVLTVQAHTPEDFKVWLEAHKHE